MPPKAKVSYPTASTNRSGTQIVTAVDCPVQTLSTANAESPRPVSASALAVHLNCSRTYIGKLEAKGVRSSGKVAASRSIRAALPPCDTCRTSGGSRHAVRRTLIRFGILQLRLMEKEARLCAPGGMSVH